MISVRERNLIESEEASALHSTYFIVYTAKYIEMWYLKPSAAVCGKIDSIFKFRSAN